MDWNTFLSYIQALPNNVNLSDDKKNVLIQPDGGGQPITLSVEKAHELILNAGKSEPSSEVIDFLNKYLKENASDLRDDDLSTSLSDKMNGLQLKVDIPETLSAVLKAAMSGTYKPEAEKTKHKVSILLHIVKPDGTVYTASGSDMIKHVPYLKYNHADHFTIEFKMKDLKETVFDGEVTDMQALLALVVALKCQPSSWKRFIWDAWLAVTTQWHILESDKEVFPCQWMKQMFYAESLVKLKDMKCLLLGQDPVSTPNETTDLTDLRKATGIAFHGIGNDNSSIHGMREHYGINCYDDEPIELCKDGQLMVNMIRTIGIKDEQQQLPKCLDCLHTQTCPLLEQKRQTGYRFLQIPSCLTCDVHADSLC